LVSTSCAGDTDVAEGRPLELPGRASSRRTQCTD
jgi:hypothetical protein